MYMLPQKNKYKKKIKITGLVPNIKVWGGRLCHFLDHIIWHNLLMIIIHSL
jgi:hypothetical protein